MGLWIMYVIIVNGIVEKLFIYDKIFFLFGVVVFDVVYLKKEKGILYFYVGIMKNYMRRIDYDLFFYKYELYINFLFILGYYIYFIVDDNWLSGFFLFWLKNRIENDEIIVFLYYNDFKLLNVKLFYYYD